MNVIFDMDGVLFDTERSYSATLEEVAADWGLGDVHEAVLGCIGRNANDSRTLFLEYMGEDFPYEEYVKETGRRFREREEREGLPIKSGVRELLSYLKQENSRIALASSTRREKVLYYLEKAGLTDYFEVVVGGDMVKHSKPQPDIYLMACRKLGVVPGETYAVEDSPNGIRSAYNAGMKAIMVPDMIEPDAEMEEKTCHICRDLIEVKCYLEAERRTAWQP